jgi:phosphatidylinositol-3-phosphatase
MLRIIITFDEAKKTTDRSDHSVDGKLVGQDGGGRVGALVISRYVKLGCDSTGYDHYGLLRNIEELFELKPLLGRAATATSFSQAPDCFHK